jgi:hypothetical protein
MDRHLEDSGSSKALGGIARRAKARKLSGLQEF